MAGKLDVSTNLLHKDIDGWCPDSDTTEELNKAFDVDYEFLCEGKRTNDDPEVLAESFAEYLSQPCAAMDAPLPACGAENPSEERKGTVRHFFRPFFVGQGMCVGRVADDRSYEMSWPSGERLVSSEPVVNVEDSQGGPVFTQTSEFELFASDEFGNELVSKAPGNLRNPPGPNGCVNETVYTLEELGEEYLDASTGDGFKPGDTLTLCIKQTGALDISCPNNTTISIPPPPTPDQTNSAVSACLLGSSCRFFNGG